MTKRALVSWEFCILKILLLAMVGVVLDRPVGSIEGQVALEQKGFGLYSYDMRQNKVFVLATARGEGQDKERGVWVKPDGTFRFDQLGTGEYSLTIRASGYQTAYENGIFVDEAKVTRIPSRIALSVQEPSVNIASNCRVFTTSEQPHFWINASGATSATVRIYRKDLLSLPNFKVKPQKEDEEEGESSQKEDQNISIGTELNIYRSGGDPEDLFGSLEPVETFTRTLQADQDDWSHAEFKVDKPLRQGDYFAVVEVKNPNEDSDWNVTWFSVSNLGLIVKQAPDKTLVRAIDLNTQKARAGVDVKLLQRDLGPLGSVKTAANGFAELRMPANNANRFSFNLVCYGTQGEDRAYGGLNFYMGDYDRYKSYFYTDRPIYRLGQTVFYKGICRYVDQGGFKTPKPGTTLDLTIEDPDNQKLWEGHATTSAHGTFNGNFQIPAEGKTGAYQVTMRYPDGVQSYERFEVAQYRKPEYQVEVVPLTPRVVAGSKVRARVKATYFFGAPVDNARVKYTIYRQDDWSSRYELLPRPAYYSYFDDWSDEDRGYYPSSGGNYVTEGYAQTDASGEAIVEFDTTPLTLRADGPYYSEYMDQKYKIEAEVTDLSRMSVVSSGSCQVTAGDFALFVEPASYVVKAGEPAKVNVTAVDYTGQPVPNHEVTVKLIRWVYDSVKYEYRGHETAGTATVVTDSAGKATATFQTKSALPTDTYYVVAEADDKSNHIVLDSSSLWVASANSPYVAFGERAQQEPLALRLDKPVYRPGETARVMVTAPVTGGEGAQALVSVEGPTLYDYRLVDLKATAQLVEIPIKESYAPNVDVTVTFVNNKHKFFNQSKSLKVSPEEHFLKLTVETDKAKYKPGEKVTYTVHAARPNGKPAANVELSLGVVDESIYAIRPEAAPNIQKFFYSRRANLVVTACSFPEQFSGGPDKIEPKVRKDFRDTAAWLPSLVTNKDGVALATITLPDNLTTWRATVRGITSGADVGATVNKVIATQDMILRLALPRFFSEGDEGLISAVVHNYTDKPQSIDLTLAASSQFQINSPLAQKLNVEPDKAQRFDWPVKVVEPGEATVFAKAVGQTAGDAIERKIPVRALGLPAFTVKNGLITEETAEVKVPVGLAADASPKTAQGQLRLAASSIGPVLGNFNTLIDYPYGCTEQTMSRLMPSVVAVRLSKSLGLPLAAKDREKFQKVYTEAMRKLTDYQHTDGGWGWWRDDASNPYLTSHVLEGFHLISQAGYKVDPELIKKGKGWIAKAVPELKKQLSDPKLAHHFGGEIEARTNLARMVYAASLYQAPCPTDVKTWLQSEVKGIAPEGLAYLVLAYSRLGDRSSAQAAYDQLVSLANEPEKYTNWDHTPAMWKKLSHLSDGWIYSYRFTGVETTALALRAVLEMAPDNTQLIESIKQWILLQHDKNGWENTKTTAEVFIALLEEELKARSQASPSFEAGAELAGSKLVTLLFNQSNIYSPESVVNVPVPATAQEMVIEKTGPGRLYYNSLMTYVRRLRAGDQVAEKSMPEGIHMKRSFFRLTPSAPTSSGTIRLTAAPLNGGSIRAGETLLMKVALETPVSLPYVIVEACLPSGAEVVEDSPEQNNIEGESGSMFEGDWGPWWWTHRDVLDDRIVFFVTDLSAGKCEFNALVRMEMPGTFQLNPMSLEGMYTRHIRAYSTLDSVKVVE